MIDMVQLAASILMAPYQERLTDAERTELQLRMVLGLKARRSTHLGIPVGLTGARAVYPPYRPKPTNESSEGDEDGCQKCEDGVLESIVQGTASRTEYSFCYCPRGRELKAEHDDALEAKGAERDQWEKKL